jgi:hypothetical protein
MDFSLNTRSSRRICPPARHPTIQTKVAAKSFWENGKPVRPSHELQKEGTPRIDLAHVGYVLYGVEENSDASSSEIAIEADNKEGTANSPDANRPPQGIAMLKDDIAEINLLIRKGTPVTIILNRK